MSLLRRLVLLINWVGRDDFGPPAEELVDEILHQSPWLLANFRSEIEMDRIYADQGWAAKHSDNSDPRAWMVSLAKNGYYFGYPECCIREFIEDFSDDEELGRRSRNDVIDHVPCRRCHRQLLPRKAA
jgi:hypothetical protein